MSGLPDDYSPEADELFIDPENHYQRGFAAGEAAGWAKRGKADAEALTEFLRSAAFYVQDGGEWPSNTAMVAVIERVGARAVSESTP